MMVEFVGEVWSEHRVLAHREMGVIPRVGEIVVLAEVSQRVCAVIWDMLRDVVVVKLED